MTIAVEEGGEGFIIEYFSRESRVEIGQAKQDRIQIDIGTWTYSGLETEFHRFAESIAGRDWGSIEGTDISIGPLNRPQGYMGRKYTIKFVSRLRGGTVVENAPLIEGKLIMQRVSDRPNTQSRFIIKAKLSLNPTRALVYQPKNNSIIDNFLGRSEDEANIPVPSLRTSELPEPIGNERAIDPTHDNVIIGRIWRIMSRPEYWSRFRNHYFVAVYGLLRELLDGTFGRENLVGGTALQLEINLKQVETYWEFYSDDPIHLVHSLEPAFMALGQEARYRQYDNVVSDSTRERNIPILTTRLSTGLIAKIYPKTNRRIRLEAMHNLQEHRLGQTGHTFTGLETAPIDAVRKIEEVANNATDEINQLLENITATMPPLPHQETPYRLIREIIASTDDVHKQDLLLSIVVNNGCFVCRPGEELRHAVERLVRRQVLRREGRYRQNFVLCPSYLNAREILLSRAPIDDE